MQVILWDSLGILVKYDVFYCHLFLVKSYCYILINNGIYFEYLLLDYLNVNTIVLYKFQRNI